MNKKSFITFIILLLSQTGCFTNNYNGSNSNDIDDVLIPFSSLASSIGNRNERDEKGVGFIFFTDPHLFSDDNTRDIRLEWFYQNLPLLTNAYEETSSQFIMCGGDLLNCNDSKSQACYKLDAFVRIFNHVFENFHIIVGNHDTNYLGVSYMMTGDYSSCVLSQNEINDAMFGGNKSYYYFDTCLTRHYCFDSGIDWDNHIMTEYKIEQIRWFAEDLIINTKLHSDVFIHIALEENNTKLTPFMEEIGKIIFAYNNKQSVDYNGVVYDFSSADGHIDIIQAGHAHKDITGFTCGGIPVVVTTTISSPEAVTQPTFDYVYINYEENTTNFKRYGDGVDRTVAM